MSLDLKGSFDIRCENCEKIYSFKPADADFREIERKTKKHGPEIHLHWDKEITCECDNEFYIKYSIWEYPENTLSDDEVEDWGFIIDKEFDIGFI